ncbi:MAG TPA: hypothetical protein VN999_08065 [Thermoanaerobaculia bacterium]|nr:hypothetical protein [Thermoanaerobaculia bacterium]
MLGYEENTVGCRPWQEADAYPPSRSIADLPFSCLLSLGQIMDRVDVIFLLRLLGMHDVGSVVPAVKYTLEYVGQPLAPGRRMMEPGYYESNFQTELADDLEANGFRHSAELLRDLVAQRGYPVLTPETAFPELRRRIDHELQSVIFLRVPQERERFFDGRERFGDEAETAFPSARYDMEEAAKCFALARYTACVLHLNRVLEVGLDALKKKTGIATHSPTWNAALAQIEKATTAKPEKDKTEAERAEDTFIRDAAHYLTTAKNAIRNPSVHKVERTYTDESAKEVYMAVRAFMRHLATKLSE